MEVEKLLEKYATPKDCLNDTHALQLLNEKFLLSGVDIGKLLGVDKSTVRNAFLRHGLQLKRTGKKTKGKSRIKNEKIRSILENKQALVDMHIRDKMTIASIANFVGVQRATIKKRFDYFGIDILRYDDVIVAKRNETMSRVYGAPNASNVEQFVDKKKQTMLDVYGSENFSQAHIDPDTYRKLNDKDWLIEQHVNLKLSVVAIADSLGVSDGTVSKLLHKHNIDIQRFTSSTGENQIRQFLESLGVEACYNVRNIIPPYEIDIYLPEHKLAIEYNGLYWHSEQGGRDKNYHLTKTTMCEENGIRLIHIFEDEWVDMNRQCKDTLTHLLHKSEKGVFARNVTIREISWKEAKSFLNYHHLLGAGTCGNYRIGAFDKSDKLIGVMVFGQQNNENSSKGVVELRRFVTDKKNNPGLGSKMFKYATREQNYNKVVAFVDRRWFTGLVKDHIGFQHIGTTPPATWWTDGYNTRVHRRFFTKRQLIKDGENETLSKREMLANKNFYRIWDCGKHKLKWKKHD